MAKIYGIRTQSQVNYLQEWLKIELPIDLYSAKKVTIRFKTESTANIFIDRLELRAKNYLTSKLTLEKISTQLEKDYTLNKAEFGDKFDTLQDSVKDRVKAGDTALALVAKRD